MEEMKIEFPDDDDDDGGEDDDEDDSVLNSAIAERDEDTLI